MLVTASPKHQVQQRQQRKAQEMLAKSKGFVVETVDAESSERHSALTAISGAQQLPSCCRLVRELRRMCRAYREGGGVPSVLPAAGRGAAGVCGEDHRTLSFPWHRTEQEFSAGGWQIREA